MDGLLQSRRRQPEWMDDPQVDPAVLQTSLQFICRVNLLLGYTRATLHHLKRFSQSWRREQRIDLIDIGTGSADIPLAILRWADRAGWKVRIVAIDRHALTARTAALAAAGDPRLIILRADALHLPFAAGSFDYALTAMFLHHLDDDQATHVIKSMDRLARRGVIISDILRTRRALLWIKVLSALSNPTVRHDAVASVAQAFKKKEILAMRQVAGLGYTRYFHHFAHRFILAGEKP